jgi:hypothetical protein
MYVKNKIGMTGAGISAGSTEEDWIWKILAAVQQRPIGILPGSWHP